MPRLFLSSVDFVSGDPTLKLEYPYTSHADTEITATMGGDHKWIYLGIPVRSDESIRAVTVHYQLANAQSFISQIRLTEQTTPDRNTVIHDDGTNLTSTKPAIYTSQVGGRAPAGAITLQLRLQFGGTGPAHKINLGAVIVDFG